MATTTLHEESVVPMRASVEPASIRDPRVQAFWMLRLAYTALPLAMGIDKFFNGMVYWPKYLAHWIANIPPGTPQQIMYGVGVLEIVAGLLVLAKPRYAAYIVALWLLGIVVNLWSGYGYWDIGARDFALMGGALVLSRLASVYDPPLRLRR
ncbi:MAG TPA: DoxX family protein [Gaiellaceae bacterium]|nr:DoxX family protein [Gaiellaceae bacterium]